MTREHEMQAVRLDDDAGVEPVGWRVVRELGGSECLYSAAEVGVVANGSARMGRMGCRRLELLSALGRTCGAARLTRCGSVASLWTPSFAGLNLSETRASLRRWWYI